MSIEDTDRNKCGVEFYDPDEPVKGSVKVPTGFGVPVYLDESVFLGGLLILSFMSFDQKQALYYGIALFSLITIHELGHIAATRYLGGRVFALHLGIIGGHCVTQRPNSVRETLILYSGGVAAQLLLFFATILAVLVTGWPTTEFASCIVITFTVINLILAVLSLLPFQLSNRFPSDGDILWKLFLHVKKGHPNPIPPLLELPSRILPPETQLLDKKASVPEGFVTGLEILNDDSTPMEFVVSMLGKHVGLDRDKSIQKMLTVHWEGGLLIPIDSMTLATEIAANITIESRAAGHVLTCRAVEKIPANSTEN